MYLTFYGAPDKNTAAVLDTLRGSGRTAAFFLPVKSADWTDDTVRRIAAEGHTLALLLDADEKASGDALVEQLTLANERLRLLTGVQTRIVSVSTGCAQLSRTQRDALIAAGYRLWDATLDAGDEKGTAARAYAETAQRFSETNATVAPGHPVRDDLARPHAHQRRKRDKIIRAAPQLPLCGIASKTACFHGFRSKAGGFSKIESFLRA